jgi:Flp pilus assembly protein TadG
MVPGRNRRLWRDETGAVAATYALALVGLVAVAGVGFDYARFAAMNSELHNAADQAALAAASQLDGSSNAIANATNAASNLVKNQTLLSNDGNASGTNVTIASLVFYSAADANGGTTVTTTPSAARFVKVTVASRQAYYALTPIVAAFSSGNTNAEATAGLGSAVCKVPPVMICNPNEGGDPTFTVANYIGKGLKLVSVGQGGGGWTAGNFGYLDSHGGSNGVPGLRQALGWNTQPGDCQPGSGVDTKPGASVTVTDSLNTRLDITSSNACPSGGTCSPSANSVKDLIKKDGTNGNACVIGPQGWGEASNPYLPSSATTPCGTGVPCTTSTTAPNYPYPDAMGYPRDMCHAVGATDTCGTGGTASPIGSGVWDVDAYFYVNYNHATHAQWTSAVAGGTNPITVSGSTAPFGVTRFKVYQWEMANAGSVAINGVTVLAARNVSGNGANILKARGAPYCITPGITPGPNTPDRRRFPVAVANCSTAANGGTGQVNGNSTNVVVQKWIDVFLVEPSANRARTNAGDVYVEVVRETTSGGDGTAGQVIRRDKPYLIK